MSDGAGAARAAARPEPALERRSPPTRVVWDHLVQPLDGEWLQVQPLDGAPLLSPRLAPGLPAVVGGQGVASPRREQKQKRVASAPAAGQQRPGSSAPGLREPGEGGGAASAVSPLPGESGLAAASPLEAGGLEEGLERRFEDQDFWSFEIPEEVATEAAHEEEVRGAATAPIVAAAAATAAGAAAPSAGGSEAGAPEAAHEADRKSSSLLPAPERASSASPPAAPVGATPASPKASLDTGYVRAGAVEVQFHEARGLNGSKGQAFSPRPQPGSGGSDGPSQPGSAPRLPSSAPRVIQVRQAGMHDALPDSGAPRDVAVAASPRGSVLYTSPRSTRDVLTSPRSTRDLAAASPGSADECASPRGRAALTEENGSNPRALANGSNARALALAPPHPGDAGGVDGAAGAAAGGGVDRASAWAAAGTNLLVTPRREGEPAPLRSSPPHDAPAPLEPFPPPVQEEMAPKAHDLSGPGGDVVISERGQGAPAASDAAPAPPPPRAREESAPPAPAGADAAAAPAGAAAPKANAAKIGLALARRHSRVAGDAVPVVVGLDGAAQRLGIVRLGDEITSVGGRETATLPDAEVVASIDRCFAPADHAPGSADVSMLGVRRPPDGSYLVLQVRARSPARPLPSAIARPSHASLVTCARFADRARVAGEQRCLGCARGRGEGHAPGPGTGTGRARAGGRWGVACGGGRCAWRALRRAGQADDLSGGGPPRARAPGASGSWGSQRSPDRRGARRSGRSRPAPCTRTQTTRGLRPARRSLLPGAGTERCVTRPSVAGAPMAPMT